MKSGVINAWERSLALALLQQMISAWKGTGVYICYALFVVLRLVFANDHPLNTVVLTILFYVLSSSQILHNSNRKTMPTLRKSVTINFQISSNPSPLHPSILARCGPYIILSISTMLHTLLSPSHQPCVFKRRRES